MSRATRPTLLSLAAASIALVIGALAPAQQLLQLNERDQWTPTTPPAPGSPEQRLLEAQLALAHGEAARAGNLAKAWLRNNPNNPLVPRATLLLGDALLAQSDEYEALFEYEAIARNHAQSAVFVTALEREFQIATAYAHGLRKKFMGLFRILSGDEEAQELLIRIQERLPGSELAEQAGMELADFYYERRDFRLASDAYDLFLRNYPRSPRAQKAKLRLIYSFCAQFNGPEQDDSGLVAASVKIAELEETDPALARDIGTEALLNRIEESEAGKLLQTAGWYTYTGDPIGAERMIRRLVQRFPRSIAALDGLRQIPGIYAQLPEATKATCPNYTELRQQMLGISWDEAGDAAPGNSSDPDAVKPAELLAAPVEPKP